MPRETHHEASSLWLERFTFAGGLLVAPTFLLVEVAAALSRYSGQAAWSKKAIDDLKSDEIIQFVDLDAVLIQGAIEVASVLQLRAGDATYVATAHQLNIPLVSWDKEQLTRAAGLITTYSPDIYPFKASDEA